MIFADVLKRLRAAADGRDPEACVGRGRVKVDQRDLAELLRQFDRLDAEARVNFERQRGGHVS